MPANRLGVTIESACQVHSRVMGVETGTALNLLSESGTESYYLVLLRYPLR